VRSVSVEPTPPLYLSTAQVLARFGDTNRMWLLRARKARGFPAPVRFPGMSGNRYLATDIETWTATAIRAANENRKTKSK
jgi:predicted DNA-binding transcriptional regulator AlpA